MNLLVSISCPDGAKAAPQLSAAEMGQKLISVKEPKKEE